MDFKELIKSKGFTTYSLAEKIGRTSTTVYRWTNGINEPSCEMIIKLSKILKVSIETLVVIFANQGGEKGESKGTN